MMTTTERDGATVTEAAVEAAARVLASQYGTSPENWGEWADEARAALTAALPHLADTDTAHTIERLEGEVAALTANLVAAGRACGRVAAERDGATEKYDALVASVRELAEQIENLREFDAFIEKDGDWLARQLRALLPEAVDAEEGKR